MKTACLFLSLALLLIFANNAPAQIYTWIDENGVKHFGNDAPPPGAKIIRSEAEIPYDASRDAERQAADQKYLKDLDQMDAESRPPSERTDQATERQPPSESVEIQEEAGGAVPGRARRRTGVENRDSRGTYSDMVPPSGSYASEEGQPGTYDRMQPPEETGVDRVEGGRREGRARPKPVEARHR